jgi:predicted molibdopterin-dependent oxidoreductase YjgC
VFGAGGGTSSYEELEETDVLVLWGSNARETHPIMFQHMLKGQRNGARLVVVDPRRTPTARWADEHAALAVGSDIALANAMAHVILAEGLQHDWFIDNSTEGLAAFRASVADTTPEWAEGQTGVPAEQIRRIARAYATAPRAIICWTLGITEHHNAVDNVLALINLALLTGHVGRLGSGLNPLRGQNNVQGGGDMGAVPLRLPGFQDVFDPDRRRPFEERWGVTLSSTRGLNVTEMLEAAGDGRLHALYVIGENPAVSDADTHHVEKALGRLDLLVVEDLFLTRTAELAHVVLPAAAGWCETEGTVTASDRRVQRIRKALDPPGSARDDLEVVQEVARRLGAGWWRPQTAREIWDELRDLSPIHRGMTYERLETGSGLRWPCWDESHPGEQFLHGRLWESPCRGPRAGFNPVVHDPPVDTVDAEYPLLLTTGRRLESFNTGVQSGRFVTPLRTDEALLLSEDDMRALRLVDGDRVRVRSRRGQLEVAVRTDDSVRAGLAFMTFHFPDQVATNYLTINAVDPLSGTAEFKASAVRVEKVVTAQAS